MRLLLFACILSTACATVLRPSTRDLVVHAPPGVKVLHGGTEMPSMTRDGALVVTVPRSVSAITLQSETEVAQTPLHSGAAAGWVVADVLLGLWPAIIDVATGAWNNFDPVDAAVLRWEPRAGGPNAAAPTQQRTARAARPPAL